MGIKVESVRPSPIIIGEDAGPLSAYTDGHGDQPLLSPTTLNNLVMSSFDQSASASFGRPTEQNGSFFPGSAFQQPAYLDTQASLPSGLPEPSELPLLSSSSYDSRDSFPSSDISLQQFGRPREALMVTAISPTQGPAGRKMCVYLDTKGHELDAASSYPAILFGSRRSNGILNRLAPQQNQQANYVLTVDIPPFDSTSSSTTQVSLSLDVGDPAMLTVVGTYTYTDATTVSTPPPGMRKRKLSVDTSMVSPGKRAATLPLSADYSLSPPSAQTMSPYSSAPGSATYSYVQTPSRPRHQLQQQNNLSTPRYGVSPQLATAHLSMGPSLPYNGHVSYGSEGSSVIGPTSSPMGPGAMSSISDGSANPALVRTSTLSYDAVVPAAGINQAFDPYSMYNSNSKANLKLQGDLNSMAQIETWTPQEVTTQRRLVRFRRNQSGSNINASFEPVTVEDHARAPGHIYVNCIWWKEKQECFITSVDTIQLLESLVAVRFTVEEKNRIRRNLEGFRPATVSKTRPDCEEFFKTIMGFPNPKPRNIEKDVKVFPWKILGTALKKIIGKYSASYASTSGPNSVSGIAPLGSNGHMRQLSSSRSSTPGGGMPFQPQAMQMLASSSPMAQHGPVPALPPQHAMAPVGMMHGPSSGMPHVVPWQAPSAQFPPDMAGARQGWDMQGFMAGPTGGPVPHGHMHPGAGQPGGPMRYERAPSIGQAMPYMGY